MAKTGMVRWEAFGFEMAGHTSSKRQVAGSIPAGRAKYFARYSMT
jgi:hypothetical protein